MPGVLAHPNPLGGLMESYVTTQHLGGSTTFTLTMAWPKCLHGAGWWEEVRVWWFRRKYFACTECRRLIPEKDMPVED